MRHACIETTLRYQVGLEAHDIAAELWVWTKSEKEKQQEPEEATDRAARPTFVPVGRIARFRTLLRPPCRATEPLAGNGLWPTIQTTAGG